MVNSITSGSSRPTPAAFRLDESGGTPWGWIVIIGIVVLVIGMIVFEILEADKTPQPPLYTTIPTVVGPKLARVVIYPKVVHAEAGRRFRLDVRAWDENGVVVPVSSANGMKITWSGGTFVPNDAAPTTFVTPNTGETTVTVDAVVTSGAGFGDSKNAESATIHISYPANTAGAKDRFTVAHADGDPPVQVLLDLGVEASTTLAVPGSDICQKDWLVSVVGKIDFSGNFTRCTASPWDIAFPEASVYSPGKEAWFETRGSFTTKQAHDGVEQPWSDSPDFVRIADAGLTTIPPPVPGSHVKVRTRATSPRKLDVQLRYYMTPTGSDLEQWSSPDGMRPVGEDLMEYVSEIHAENLTGIRFVGAGHDQSRLKKDQSVSLGLFNQTTGCQLQQSTTGVLTWAEEEFDINLEDHLLHLVFVNQVAGSSVGEACPAWGRNGRLVVLEWGETDRGWLAHELAHQLALGLELPMAGHTTSYTAHFDHTNAMATNRQLAASTNQTHFSLGQSFRMNFDERSWLSLAVPGADTRKCAAQWVDPLKTGECPVLQADFVPFPPP